MMPVRILRYAAVEFNYERCFPSPQRHELYKLILLLLLSIGHIRAAICWNCHHSLRNFVQLDGRKIVPNANYPPDTHKDKSVVP